MISGSNKIRLFVSTSVTIKRKISGDRVVGAIVVTFAIVMLAVVFTGGRVVVIGSISTRNTTTK